MPRKQYTIHYIYKTTNILNGKFYIGMHSTFNLEDGYLGSGKRLRYSINKYGKENHKKEILEYCKNREELKEREKQIVTEDLIQKQLCINLKIGGEGGSLPGKDSPNYGRKFKFSDKHKINISLARQGMKFSDNHRKSLSTAHQGLKLGPHSEETRKKISIGNKGKKISNETKLKMSKAALGRTPWNKGLKLPPLSEEHKA